MQVRFIMFLSAKKYNFLAQEFEGKTRLKIQTDPQACFLSLDRQFYHVLK